MYYYNGYISLFYLSPFILAASSYCFSTEWLRLDSAVKTPPLPHHPESSTSKNKGGCWAVIKWPSYVTCRVKCIIEMITITVCQLFKNQTYQLSKDRDVTQVFCNIIQRDINKLNKRPQGLNGHLSNRDFTLNSCQKGAYLHINSPIIIINKNQQLYRKAAS